METQKLIWVINCLGLSNGDILWIALATLYQELSAFLLLMEIAISAFKSNQIQEPSPKTGYRGLAKFTHKINHHKKLQDILDEFYSSRTPDFNISCL